MRLRIEGIVTRAAAGSGEGQAWDLILFLCPWREIGGRVNAKELRLLVPMKDRAEATRAMTEWKDKAVALSLMRLEAPSEELPMGLALGHLPLERIEPDAEFLEIVGQRAKPRSVEDPILGKLVLDRRASWYKAERAPGKETYAVAVQTADPDDDAAVVAAISRAGPVIRHLDGALPALFEAIALEMLELYNSTWREEAPVLSIAEFKRRLSLGSVVVEEDRTTAYFDCDGLFTDHVIEVRMSPGGSVTEICLAG